MYAKPVYSRGGQMQVYRLTQPQLLMIIVSDQLVSDDVADLSDVF